MNGQVRRSENTLQLVPHLLLRTDTAPSRSAVALRSAGYLVTRVLDDETVMQLVTTLHIEAVVVELPSFSAIGFARRFREERGEPVPLILVTKSPDVVRKAVDADASLSSSSDLVSEVEAAMARHALKAFAAM